MAANAIEDALGIRLKRIQKTRKKTKEKLYWGVNQGYQRAISPLSKFYFGHFSGYFHAHLSIIEACPWFLKTMKRRM